MFGCTYWGEGLIVMETYAAKCNSMANIKMDEKTKHLLDIYFAQENNDLEKRIEHFELINNSLFILTQSLFENKEKVKYHQREVEGKFFRFGLANQSLISLIKGNYFIECKLNHILLHFICSLIKYQTQKKTSGMIFTDFMGFKNNWVLRLLQIILRKKKI